MPGDPEIDAMSAVAAALTQLEDDAARARVVRWAAERYEVTLGAARKPSRQDDPGSNGDEGEEEEGSQADFDDFVDLLDKVDVNTDVERAVTAAYWLQVVQSKPSWQSQEVNNMLKDVGHGSRNITDALTSAQQRKPALVRQMAKSGRSRQARKTFKLTSAGVSFVAEKAGLRATSVKSDDEAE